MIKKRGTFKVCEEGPLPQELLSAVERLRPGEYKFLIYDNNKNRLLPQLKYLNGIVLKKISDFLPEHPDIGALYKYYEGLYAPKHVCKINGFEFTYVDLKTENSTEMNNVIDKIIHHANLKWGIKIPTMEEMKVSEEKEAYVGAYTEDWESYNFNQ